MTAATQMLEKMKVHELTSIETNRYNVRGKKKVSNVMTTYVRQKRLDASFYWKTELSYFV